MRLTDLTRPCSMPTTSATEASATPFALRHIVASDQPRVFAGLSNPDVVRHYGLSYATLAATDEQMRWYAEIAQARTGLWLAIADAARDEMIGAVGCYDLDRDNRCADFGYWLLPAYWGQGVARRAIERFLPHVWQGLGVHRLAAYVELDNRASQGLLARLGFRLEGVLRECERKGEQFISLQCHALLAHEWAGSTEPAWRP